MAGIENITAEIISEAKREADSIIDEAKNKGEELKKEAMDMASEAARDADEKSKGECDSYARRIDSQIGLNARQQMLGARQSIIEEVINKAASKLYSLDDEKYFEMLKGLIASHIRPADGEIMFSKRDMSRLPEGFADEVEKIAKENGGSLSLNDEPADIEGGFILRYGGIDENCSLSTLFSEKQDMLRDRAREVLWG